MLLAHHHFVLLLCDFLLCKMGVYIHTEKHTEREKTNKQNQDVHAYTLTGKYSCKYMYAEREKRLTCLYTHRCKYTHKHKDRHTN